MRSYETEVRRRSGQAPLQALLNHKPRLSAVKLMAVLGTWPLKYLAPEYVFCGVRVVGPESKIITATNPASSTVARFVWAGLGSAQPRSPCDQLGSCRSDWQATGRPASNSAAAGQAVGPPPARQSVRSAWPGSQLRSGQVGSAWFGFEKNPGFWSWIPQEEGIQRSSSAACRDSPVDDLKTFLTTPRTFYRGAFMEK